MKTFVALPVLGAPKLLKSSSLRGSVFADFAKCYRAKFFLSYALCLARALFPALESSVSRLARRYTVFGPAPRVLFRTFTGKADTDPSRGCVAFARNLRDLLQRDFNVDLELYSIQYAPCLYHRFCPLASRAVTEGIKDAFARSESETRAAGRVAASLEEERLEALLAP